MAACALILLAFTMATITFVSAPGHAPPWMVPIVRDEVRRLTPGMTEQEVWSRIGPCRRFIGGGHGMGSQDNYQWSHSLRPGCGIIFTFDYTARPPRLVGANLVGDGW